MNTTNPQYRRPMSETPEKFPVLVFEKGCPYVVDDKDDWWSWKEYGTGWQPLEILPEAPRDLTQEEKDIEAYEQWYEDYRLSDPSVVWLAALAWERKEIAALLPKLDDFDGTFNALADLLDECDVNVRISDALRQLHARLSASAEKPKTEAT